MTANEIYAWKPISVSKDIYNLLEHTDIYDYSNIAEDKNEHIELRYYTDFSFDGERTFIFYSVWFIGHPVMICQEAGRGSRDHRDQFITDAKRYKKMIKYIQSLISNEVEVFAINPNEDVPALSSFYGRDVSNYYDPNFKPKYKVGDIVEASVLVDHLRMAYTGKEYINTRCMINTVREYDPTNTYHMSQLDRRWENEKEKKARGCNDFIGNMVFDKGKGDIGASGNDKTIVGYWKD